MIYMYLWPPKAADNFAVFWSKLPQLQKDVFFIFIILDLEKSTSAFENVTQISEIYYAKFSQNLNTQLQLSRKLWGFPDAEQKFSGHVTSGFY